MLSVVKTPRPTIFDSARNPANKQLIYEAAGVAPAAITVRATITLVAGKSYACRLISCSILRDAVAGTSGLVEVRLRTATNPTNYFGSRFFNNTVGALQETQTGESFIEPAPVGNWQLTTSDASTTGTMNFFIHIWFTEFDA